MERGHYRQDVRDTAQSIIDECKGQYKDGVRGEPLREWLLEHIHETIDGSPRVIYTYLAQECLMESSNDSAYFENFGSEGAVSKDGINWGALAYCAFEADVIEEMGILDFDVNNPGAGFTDDDEGDGADAEA